MPYNAIIAEGTAEQIILTKLLEADCLIFPSETLLDRKVIRTRSANSFATQYLNHSFDERVQVYRILDSKKENFKIRKPYETKIEVHNVLTTPEIEMLLICSEGYLSEYKNTNGMKPSTFIKQKFSADNIKSAAFNKSYWTSAKIVKAIITYHRTTPDTKDMTLYDLIKPNVLKININGD